MGGSGLVTWRPVQPLGAWADATDFLETVSREAFLDPAGEAVVARAPGRLDVMGGIADYSGSLVLQLPLSLAAFAAAQPQPEPAITIRSLQAGQTNTGRAAARTVRPTADRADVTIPLSAIAPGGEALDYGDARRLFEDANGDARAKWPHWAAYVAGALVVLGRERGVRIDRGIRILIDSRVPLGKGVSSSAALEVAAMRAIAAVYGVTLSGEDLAILCQMVENRVVGAPCGLMDQMTASLGERDRLLALLCQPARVLPSVGLPEAFDVWGIDSGVRHAVSGSDYTSVRIGAFMGYRIIADIAGLEAGATDAGRVTIHDPHWSGYLANVTTAAWRERFRDRVPATMHGGEFLSRYGGTTDHVVRVDPGREYAVRSATAHPIHEHERVTRFGELLGEAQQLTGDAGRSPSSGDLRHERLGATGRMLGELMNGSHAGYSACGLGAAATDRLFELVREAGPERGLYGARITGGGSGGTVAVIGRQGADQAVRQIARRFREETGAGGTVLRGSSGGATAFGIVRVSAVPD